MWKSFKSFGVNVNQYERVKTYSYSQNNKQSKVGNINTVLKLINVGQGLYFNKKETQRILREGTQL